MNDAYRNLLGERGQLRQLLEKCGADEVIVRAGFEYRLQQVESAIAAYEARRPDVLTASRLDVPSKTANQPTE